MKTHLFATASLAAFAALAALPALAGPGALARAAQEAQEQTETRADTAPQSAPLPETGFSPAPARTAFSAGPDYARADPPVRVRDPEPRPEADDDDTNPQFTEGRRGRRGPPPQEWRAPEPEQRWQPPPAPQAPVFTPPPAPVLPPPPPVPAVAQAWTPPPAPPPVRDGRGRDDRDRDERGGYGRDRDDDRGRDSRGGEWRAPPPVTVPPPPAPPPVFTGPPVRGSGPAANSVNGLARGEGRPSRARDDDDNWRDRGRRDREWRDRGRGWGGGDWRDPRWGDRQWQDYYGRQGWRRDWYDQRWSGGWQGSWGYDYQGWQYPGYSWNRGWQPGWNASAPPPNSNRGFYWNGHAWVPSPWVWERAARGARVYQVPVFRSWRDPRPDVRLDRSNRIFWLADRGDWVFLRGLNRRYWYDWHRSAYYTRDDDGVLILLAVAPSDIGLGRALTGQF